MKMTRWKRTVFNNACPWVHAFPASCGRLRIATWNARSLLFFRKALRRQKMALLKRLLSCDIIFVNELHGNSAWLDLELRNIGFRGTCRTSYDCHREDKGGVAFLLPNVDPFDPRFFFDVLAPGRCLDLGFRDGSVRCHFTGLHNYDVNLSTARRINSCVKSNASYACGHPTTAFSCFLGDWNFIEAGDATYNFSDPSASTFLSPSD